MAEPTPNPELPGVPLSFGFDFTKCVDVGLSPEARKRVNDKIASVQEARRRAMESADRYVIGGGS